MKILKNRFAIIYYVTLLLSACGGSFESSTQGYLALPSIQGGMILPDTDKLDKNCEISSDFDACIFLKSPTHQLGQIFSSSTEIASARHWGIKLTGLDDSGFLKSNNVVIASTEKPQIKVSEASAEALMSYYWAERAFEFYNVQTEGLSNNSENRLKIIIDDNTAGFRSSTNSIHLSVSKDRLPMALDATVMLHYLGQANVFWASKGEIKNYNQDVSHRSCGGDPKGCCTSKTGCSSAIVSGSADYFTASFFPDAPSISNAWSKNIEGQDVCGVPRSMTDAKSLLAPSAFEKCGDDLTGQVHLLGLLYASIWWEVRNQIVELKTGEVPYVDRLFFAHLKELRGHHNFTDALKIILSLDQNLYKGRFSHLFTTEFRRRGL